MSLSMMFSSQRLVPYSIVIAPDQELQSNETCDFVKFLSKILGI